MLGCAYDMIWYDDIWYDMPMISSLKINIICGYNFNIERSSNFRQMVRHSNQSVDTSPVEIAVSKKTAAQRPLALLSPPGHWLRRVLKHTKRTCSLRQGGGRPVKRYAGRQNGSSRLLCVWTRNRISRTTNGPCSLPFLLIEVFLFVSYGQPNTDNVLRVYARFTCRTYTSLCAPITQ